MRERSDRLKYLPSDMGRGATLRASRSRSEHPARETLFKCML